MSSSHTNDRVAIQGTAYNAKMGALIANDDGQVWVDLKEWPSRVVGKTVRATGIWVTKRDLPVFEQKKSDPIRAGIPVPEGTDLEEASKHEVLSALQWEVVE